jgi:hypothetical protein
MAEPWNATPIKLEWGSYCVEVAAASQPVLLLLLLSMCNDDEVHTLFVFPPEEHSRSRSM